MKKYILPLVLCLAGCYSSSSSDTDILHEPPSVTCEDAFNDPVLNLPKLNQQELHEYEDIVNCVCLQVTNVQVNNQYIKSSEADEACGLRLVSSITFNKIEAQFGDTVLDACDPFVAVCKKL